MAVSGVTVRINLWSVEIMTFQFDDVVQLHDQDVRRKLSG